MVIPPICVEIAFMSSRLRARISLLYEFWPPLEEQEVCRRPPSACSPDEELLWASTFLPWVLNGSLWRGEGLSPHPSTDDLLWAPLIIIKRRIPDSLPRGEGPCTPHPLSWSGTFMSSTWCTFCLWVPSSPWKEEGPRPRPRLCWRR